MYEDDSYCYELSSWAVISDFTFESIKKDYGSFQRSFLLLQEWYTNEEAREIMEFMGD